MKPLFSIIVPVYNVEKFISRCINSVISQSYEKWELILVDDGSPDDSGHICDDFQKKDCRIKVIHKANGGVSTARNVGIERARGEWVGFIDSDDYVESDWLESIVDKIRELPADMYTWGYTKETPDGMVLQSSVIGDVTFEDGLSFVNSVYYKHGMPWFLFKRELIERYNCRCPEGIKHSEDQCFLLKYLIHNPKIVCIPRHFYHYIDNPVSCVNQKLNLDSFKDNVLVSIIIAEYAKRYDDINSRFIDKVCRQFFIDYIGDVTRNRIEKNQLSIDFYKEKYSILCEYCPHLRRDFILTIGQHSLRMAAFCAFFKTNIKTATKNCLS